jgi:hypothetical protein
MSPSGADSFIYLYFHIVDLCDVFSHNPVICWSGKCTYGLYIYIQLVEMIMMTVIVVVLEKGIILNGQRFEMRIKFCNKM